LVIFGGKPTSNSLSNETWFLTLSSTPAWTQSTAGTPPSPRGYANGIYDVPGQRIVVFGGQDGVVIPSTSVGTCTSTVGALCL
jgi:hypothetical protein